MIALTTPTGNIGSKVLSALLSHPDVQRATTPAVRLLVRNPARLPAAVHNAAVAGIAEIITGNIHNGDDLARTFAGAQTALWCQPDCPEAPDYLAAYEALATTGRDALRAAAVPHVVINARARRRAGG
ncbi:hypothetical protein DB346_19675 [Verrucomicrobia bacterium LW23]|nr:hypothetical protein DB346_19675 [Verrucomicrobia bacterium LW23]